jgi:hypothetical protein
MGGFFSGPHLFHHNRLRSLARQARRRQYDNVAYWANLVRCPLIRELAVEDVAGRLGVAYETQTPGIGQHLGRGTKTHEVGHAHRVPVGPCVEHPHDVAGLGPREKDALPDDIKGCAYGAAYVASGILRMAHLVEDSNRMIHMHEHRSCEMVYASIRYYKGGTPRLLHPKTAGNEDAGFRYQVTAHFKDQPAPG